MNAQRVAVIGSLVLMVLAGHVLAVQETVDERAQSLPRDQEMIQVLVEGGLDLAGEEDPLKRAAVCNRIANGLAEEVKKAVGSKDSARAAKLGKQMQDLLVHGVAVNLTVARETMKPNSPREKAIFKLGANVAGVAKSIEDEVNNGGEPEKMKLMLQTVIEGKNSVDQAIHGKGPPKN